MSGRLCPRSIRLARQFVTSTNPHRGIEGEAAVPPSQEHLHHMWLEPAFIKDKTQEPAAEQVLHPCQAHPRKDMEHAVGIETTVSDHAVEVRIQHPGHGEHDLPVGHRTEDRLVQPFGEDRRPLCAA